MFHFVYMYISINFHTPRPFLSMRSQYSLFQGILDGRFKLHLENLTDNPEHAAPEFNVGDIVDVARRTCARGANPEHGAARITSRKLNESQLWVYDIVFVLGPRKESGVPSHFLSSRNTEGRRCPTRGQTQFL